MHTFSCDCPDYLIKNNVCKHIFACIIKTRNASQSTQSAEEVPEILMNHMEKVFVIQEQKDDNSVTKREANIIENIEVAYSLASSIYIDDWSENEYLGIVKHLDRSERFCLWKRRM